MKLFSVILFGLVLSGCSGLSGGGGPRVQFASAAKSLELVYAASAQRYVLCHNKAGSDLGRQRLCFDEKNDRADRIDEALPLVIAFGESLIALDQIPDASALAKALRVLLSMRNVLADELGADALATMAYLDGGER